MSLSVLIAVTHLLGVGHLTRAAALARALAARGHRVTLVSGGSPAPLVDCAGVDLVQLPPVRIEGTAFSRLLAPGGEPADAGYLARRRNVLLDALEKCAPDVVITELYPFGRRALADEFKALLAAAASRRPRPAILASLRDILVSPERADRIDGTHDLVAASYDGLLVHGDPAVVPLTASWPLEPALEGLVTYTGYVGDGREPAQATNATGEILVSGGGSAASLPLFRAALAAAGEIDDRPWRILVGGGVAGPDFDALATAAPAHVRVERARADFPALLSACAVSVSQAGYNTLLDLARAGCRAVLVPFEAGRETEQRLRAERFAGRGLALVVPEADLSGASLARAVRAALDAPLAARGGLAMDGARRSAEAVEEMARRPALDRAFARFDLALARLAARGARVAMWWRDDDAVAATPALDRLLALAHRHEVPVALAAVPAGIEAFLPERLTGTQGVSVLVHGLAHANHAPPGAKKAEFGPHRPVSTMAEEAREGLARVRTAFGERALPVFVPPWNRFDPALVPALAEAGFRGLSAFAGPEGEDGITRVDTHADPIAWRGDRGLADAEAFLASLAATLTRAASDPDFGPVGLLTHHLVHDEAVWSFLDRLLAILRACPVIRWCDAQDIFCVDHRAGKAHPREV